MSVKNLVARPLVRSIVRSVSGQAPAGGGEPSEFITNGNFNANGTNWTMGDGWSADLAEARQEGLDGLLSQNFGALTAPLIDGNDYSLTFDVREGDGGGDILIVVGGTQNLPSVASSNGAKTRNFTADGNHATISFQCLDAAFFILDDISLVPAP